MARFAPLLLLFACLLAACVSPAKRSTPLADPTATLQEVAPGSTPGAIVFVHGWAEGPEYWDRLIEALSAGEPLPALWVLRLPGHDGSPALPDPSTPADVGRWLLGQLEARGLQGVALVGHGYGAAIGIEAAGQDTAARITRVVAMHALYNVAQPFDPAAAGAMVAGLKQDARGNLVRFAHSVLPDARQAQLADWVGERMGRQSGAGLAPAMRGLAGWDLRPALHRVQVPVRIINGTFRPTLLQVAQEHLKDVAVETCGWMQGLGYAPMLQDPEACAAALRRALQPTLAPAVPAQ
ncbi:MAG: alpha/beta hydrolase [Planctomycetota bacterium]